MGITGSAEMSGMELRTRTKKLGAKEEAGNCTMRVAIIERNIGFHENLLKTGARKLIA